MVVAMVDDALMSIGMFSRSSFLSIKALRRYHSQGLLVPAEVDPETGYRSYHTGQLTDAAVLRRLRDLDLPLNEVKEILTVRDPEVTRKVLDAHRVAMERRLTEIERIVAELQAASEEPSAQTPVHLKEIPHTHALAVSATVPAAEFAAFLTTAFDSLLRCAMKGFTISGPSGALYNVEIHDSDQESVTAFLPVTEPAPVEDLDAGVRVIELPAETMAVIVHHGDYDTIDQTYAALGAWVARNARPNDRPVREDYLVSVQDTADVNDFRTQIGWPIHPATQSSTTGPGPERS